MNTGLRDLKCLHTLIWIQNTCMRSSDMKSTSYRAFPHINFRELAQWGVHLQCSFLARVLCCVVCVCVFFTGIFLVAWLVCFGVFLNRFISTYWRFSSPDYVGGVPFCLSASMCCWIWAGFMLCYRLSIFWIRKLQ